MVFPLEGIVRRCVTSSNVTWSGIFPKRRVEDSTICRTSSTIHLSPTGNGDRRLQAQPSDGVRRFSLTRLHRRALPTR